MKYRECYNAHFRCFFVLRKSPLPFLLPLPPPLLPIFTLKWTRRPSLVDSEFLNSCHAKEYADVRGATLREFRCLDMLAILCSWKQARHCCRSRRRKGTHHICVHLNCEHLHFVCCESFTCKFQSLQMFEALSTYFPDKLYADVGILYCYVVLIFMC